MSGIIPKEYRGRKRYTLGVPMDNASRMLEEWLHLGMPCDIRVGRAKTKGLCFVQVDADMAVEKECSGIYWLSWIKQHCGEVKVDIKDL